MKKRPPNTRLEQNQNGRSERMMERSYDPNFKKLQETNEILHLTSDPNIDVSILLLNKL